MYTASLLADDLKQAGLVETDTVLVHSSMKKIGAVEGGARGVIDTLIAFFGKKGLLVFPSLSYSLVNKENPFFSVTETTSVIGLLPELFRTAPGVRRSLHPTHSLAAFGTDAESFLAGHDNFDTPCARLSPWGRLYDRSAKILYLGVTLGCSTYFHALEEWSGVPDMFTENADPVQVTGYDGVPRLVPTRRHFGHHNARYGEMTDFLLQNGALRRGRFGDAELLLLDARKGGDLILARLKENPGLFC